jgi:hypothetical protein
VNHKESGEVPVTVAQPGEVNAADRVSLKVNSVVHSVALKAGDSAGLTVTIEDRYGNRVTGLAGGNNRNIDIWGMVAGQSNEGLHWQEGSGENVGIYTSTMTMTRAGEHQLKAEGEC